MTLCGIEFVVDDDDLVAYDSDGNFLGRTTVADALIRIPALQALVRYEAIGEDGF